MTSPRDIFVLYLRQRVRVLTRERDNLHRAARWLFAICLLEAVWIVWLVLS